MSVPMRLTRSGWAERSAARLWMTPRTAPSGMRTVTALGRYMPMPTAMVGRDMRLVVRVRISSMMMTTTPMRAPRPRSPQSMEPPKTPVTREEMRLACGAARAFSPAPGAPTKPKAVCMRSRTGGMTIAPKRTPMSRATCCFQGVESTSWPVLRSWRLSLEIVAMPKTTAAVKSV